MSQLCLAVAVGCGPGVAGVADSDGGGGGTGDAGDSTSIGHDGGPTDASDGSDGVDTGSGGDRTTGGASSGGAEHGSGSEGSTGAPDPVFCEDAIHGTTPWSAIVDVVPNAPLEPGSGHVLALRIYSPLIHPDRPGAQADVRVVATDTAGWELELSGSNPATPNEVTVTVEDQQSADLELVVTPTAEAGHTWLSLETSVADCPEDGVWAVEPLRLEVGEPVLPVAQVPVQVIIGYMGPSLEPGNVIPVASSETLPGLIAQPGLPLPFAIHNLGASPITVEVISTVSGPPVEWVSPIATLPIAEIAGGQRRDVTLEFQTDGELLADDLPQTFELQLRTVTDGGPGELLVNTTYSLTFGE